jgi:hypothetical protein
MKKTILITILLFVALPVYARVSSLTGESYDILTTDPNETTVVSVQGFPSWQDCHSKKVTENCSRQDAWRIESQQLWQDCKDGKDISAIIDSMDCSQGTYEEYLDMKVKAKKDAILQKEKDAVAATSLAEKNKMLEKRVAELEKKIGIKTATLTPETASETNSETAPDSTPETPAEQTPTEESSIEPLDIVSIAPISDINVEYGTKLDSANLPATVSAVMSDESVKDIPVVWDGGIPEYDRKTSGTYVFAGALTLPENTTNTNSLSTTVNVIVGEKSEDAISVIEDSVSATADIIQETVSVATEAVADVVQETVSTASDAVVDVVQETASSLSNGVWNFLKWLFTAPFKNNIFSSDGILKVKN